MQLQTVLNFVRDLEHFNSDGKMFGIVFTKEGEGFVEIRGMENKTLFAFGDIDTLEMHMKNFYKVVNKGMKEVIKKSGSEGIRVSSRK